MLVFKQLFAFSKCAVLVIQTFEIQCRHLKHTNVSFFNHAETHFLKISITAKPVIK
jgi:hypothetical protein